MFGARNAYKDSFQLWIPDELLANWSKCFEFHKLAVEAMRSGAGAPVWLSDHKTTPTAAASIDRSSVDFEGGEMSFGIFDFDEVKHGELMNRNGQSDTEMLNALKEVFSDTEFPDYVQKYLIQNLARRNSRVSFHQASSFGQRAKTYTPEERASIRRKKGIFATNEYNRSEIPSAMHHLKIFYNDDRKARLFYKINESTIRFIQSRK